MKFTKDTNGLILLTKEPSDELKNTYTFNEVKQIYADFRKIEWQALKEYLKNKNIKIKEFGNSGHGVVNYKVGGQLENPYDMTNWLWIEIEIKSNKFLISFQPPAKNPKTLNEVVLMDRIGIFKYDNVDEKPPFDAVIKEVKITDIDLPLSEKNREDIYNMILSYQ